MPYIITLRFPLISTVHFMKSLIFISLALPAALFARPADDRKIEIAAQASYNYPTVLEDRIKVKVQEGVLTLTGSVADKDDKALAQDTVEHFPGVAGVKNEIVVVAAPAEGSDAWLALKIRTQLLVKASVSASTTTVAVQDGVVTLGGHAANLAQKELTAIYTQEIEGVKAVVNTIVVKDQTGAAETLADKIDDASITTQVKYALIRHKATNGLEAKVVTNDGKITITGEAASKAEKALITKLAQDVRGAKSVTNGMTVKS